MKNKILLTFSTLLIIFSCNNEDQTPILPTGVIESSKEFYVVRDLVELKLESSSLVEKVTWDFGNGETSDNQIGRVLYTEPGIYEVKLTLTDTKGNTNVLTKKVIVGQYYGYEAILHRVSNGYDGTTGDVQLQLRNSFSDEEPFWASAVFENFDFEDLPLAIEIDVPLGGGNKYIVDSPVVRFIETNTGITLGGQGASTGYQYFEGEFFVGGLGTYSIKYRLVLPEE
ncbi:PDK repeat-containing protein [Belliella baltica DSM 15883]|uniref:PDK repeat-containing protein n=1 Tax=Belliella baltica (strain DSM 15883 / CIP 108006 / LMG 21964 / BA134) TaxID=866536 RepID=I3Z449_BELBD|nr:PKD domain-containing protein [Belliella baltica]AFL84017.1 PDK repeat-containing protein [Belliella baltica DSM 15883]